MRNNLKSLLRYHAECARTALAVLLFLLVIWGGQDLLIACKSKPKPDQAQTPPSTPPVDSTRLDLEIKLKGSSNTVTVSQGNSQTAVADYEKAKTEFDKTRVTLP